MAEQVSELLTLASKARDLEQYEAAFLVFLRILQLESGNLEAATAVADLADQLGRAAEAIEARLVLVEDYIHHRKLERASEVIAEILAVAPNQPLALSFREFVDARRNPELVIGDGVVVAATDPDDDVTSPVTLPEEPEGEPGDPEQEWEARTTGIIAAGNMLALLARPAAPAPVDDDAFAEQARTIAVTGQGAAIAMAGLIQTSPLLRALDAVSCGRLLDESEVLQCFASQVVVEQGSSGSSLYLLLEGEAALERAGQVVEPLVAGDFFGEASLLGKTPRLATLKMVGDGTVLEIERSTIKLLSAQHGPLLDVLAHVLRRRAIAIRASESDFFRRIPKALLEELSPLFHLHKLGPGDTAITQSEVPSGYWEVVVGRLDSPDGRSLGAGGVFGAGALRGEPSPETLAAVQPSWLLELPVVDLRKMLERYPRLREALE